MKNPLTRVNKILLIVLMALILVNAGVFALIVLPGLLNPMPSIPQTQISSITTPSQIPFTTPHFDITPASTSDVGQVVEGAIILSLQDGNYAHLFAFHPQYLPLTRLTDSPWDDIDPAISPDGTKVAYSSRQNGYWDLFLLDLQTGKNTRLTDTPQYDGSPSWSPDGIWLVYESYTGSGLDLFLMSATDPSQTPIQLTQDSGFNFSPTWSWGGIAFVSTRSGDEEIWTANLNTYDDRFKNISQNKQTSDSNPAWSPDGRYLIWSSTTDEGRLFKLWDAQNPQQITQLPASGDFPVWSPDGSKLLSLLSNPNDYSLCAYKLSDFSLFFPVTKLPGEVYGMDWSGSGFTAALENYPFPPNSQASAPPLWKMEVDITSQLSLGRSNIVPLVDVIAPFPYLHDSVDEAFVALRTQTAQETGWDVLANLENAFYPITAPPQAGKPQDWLATGRAFALNTLPMDAEWMLIVREDYNGQTFWRLYLKARYQDGSQGIPLTRAPWDMNARYSNDTLAFEAGGKYAPIPEGYWVDFTALALRYNWERLPSLQNWRAFYPATRFNQFILPGNLDWDSAMAQLYPPEALVTATGLPTFTPTHTPTITPRWRWASLTFTPTPTPILSVTPRPTWTPLPGTNQP